MEEDLHGNKGRRPRLSSCFQLPRAVPLSSLLLNLLPNQLPTPPAAACKEGHLLLVLLSKEASSKLLLHARDRPASCSCMAPVRQQLLAWIAMDSSSFQLLQVSSSFQLSS